MSKLIICSLLLLATLGCHLDKGESDSETEFVALVQQNALNFFRSVLIRRVHNPDITIDYGFSNNNCGGLFDDQHQQQIKASVSKSLRVWLAPLADRGEIGNTIVDIFKYRYRETEKDNYFGYLKFTDHLPDNKEPDLSIIFYCQEGRSFALTTNIHMYQWHEQLAEDLVSDRAKYSLKALHHEIGHAFGLGDTYVDSTESSSWEKRHNVSDGGDAGTVGKQPLSVMNLHYLLATDSAGELQLGNDDIAGINWLYDYYVVNKNSRKRDVCPDDYLYEGSTKGCIPKYPLIFAVKQNNYTVVDRILSSDSTIDLDQQDELGNTALHYAASAKGVHGEKIYKYLIDRGADTNLRNKEDKTARELLTQP